MAEEEVKNEDGKAAEGGEKKKSSLPLVIGIIVGVLVVQAIMLFLFMTLTKPVDPEEEKAKAVADSLKQVQVSKTSVGTILDIPLEAVVNIAGTDGGRFLKIVVQAEYDADRYKNLPTELAKREVVFKNILIEQLSALTLPELQDVDAKTAIRKEFKRRVNNTLPQEVGEISDIYIVEFIIQ